MSRSRLCLRHPRILLCFHGSRHFARFRIVRRVNVRRHSAHPNVRVRAKERGKPKLVSSDGYSFTFKTKKQAVWQCSVRRKAFMCTASVMQEGDIFQAKGTHTHAADPSMRKKVELKRNYFYNNGDEANTDCDSERGCELSNDFKEPLVKRSTL
ncbi:hypothetical protein DPMN_127741 [Dreissena polymorpha]|uniref:FLYWCH-type domain-containing protein n=1 Tax=Dreissena polymorpha TaxID=45954 RepID=A0A9D4JZG3_DREPO|nr:hypothetical protein DPMN_127741 [Dreissena polymorpha]